MTASARIVIAFVVAVLPVLGCSNDNPSSPTPPAPTPTYTLNGTIRNLRQETVQATDVEIVTGPVNGRKTNTKLFGEYEFQDLPPGAYDLRISGQYVVTQTVAVSLTGNLRRDIQALTAILTPFDPLTFTTEAGGFRFTGHLRNDGDACATRIAGTTRFETTDGLTPTLNETIPWVVLPAVLSAPGAVLTYTGCCLPLAWSGRDGEYFATIDHEAVACQ